MSPPASPCPQPSASAWENRCGCVSFTRSPPSGLTRLQQLCCLMTSESFGCHDFSRHRWGEPARWERDGRAAASACRSRLTRSRWWLPASSGRTARRWGATGRGLGALRVGGTFVQYAQPVASGSRPSWNRSTRAGSRAEPASNHDHRAPAQTAGRGQWGRTYHGGAGLCRTNHGLSLLRDPVSTALTLAGPTSVRPAGIVGILRFLSGVPRRYAFNVSTMDTSDLPGPARPLPLVPSSPPGPPACPGFPPERVSQKS